MLLPWRRVQILLLQLFRLELVSPWEIPIYGPHWPRKECKRHIRILREHRDKEIEHAIICLLQRHIISCAFLLAVSGFNLNDI